MSTSTSSLIHDAPHLPAPTYRTHSNSPSRSPKRLHLSTTDGLDRRLQDLSPTTIIDAFRSTPQAVPRSGSFIDELLRSINDTSVSERGLGLRAAETLKRLRSWCRELDEWEWTGSFEPRDSSMLVPKPDGVIPAADSQGAALRRSDVDRTIRNADKEECWGSLPARMVVTFERRIEAIREELSLLNIEDLKEHVLSVHIPSKSRPTSFLGQDFDRTSSTPQYKTLDGVTTVITATILHSLPYLSRLTQLLNSWTIRTKVLRMVPELLEALTELDSALHAAWTTIRAPQHVANVQTEQKLDSLGVSVKGLRRGLANKVRDVGRRLDDVLDMIEGRQETIPDAWIDNFESLEEQFGAWVAEAEQRVEEHNWRATLKSDGVNIIEDHDRATQPVGSHLSNDGVSLSLQAGDSHTNEQEHSSPASEPEELCVNEYNVAGQTGRNFPPAQRLQGAIKRDMDRDASMSGADLCTGTVAPAIEVQAPVHSHLQRPILLPAENSVETLVGSESSSRSDIGAGYRNSTDTPGYPALSQVSTLVEHGTTQGGNPKGIDSSEDEIHADSDDILQSDALKFMKPSAYARRHGSLLLPSSGADHISSHEAPKAAFTLPGTADVFQISSLVSAPRQSQKGSTTVNVPSESVSSSGLPEIVRLEEQLPAVDVASGENMPVQRRASTVDNATTNIYHTSKDGHQSSLDGFQSRSAPERPLLSPQLGSPWESPTRTLSADSQIQQDTSVPGKVDNADWVAAPGATPHDDHHTSWYYGSDSDAVSPEPSLVVQSSSVTSTSMDEDSDDSDSSLESVEELKGEAKRKDPPAWISTSPPKDQYRHSAALATLSEVSTPGSAGYRSDLSSPEIRQAAAAEYFVPVEVTTPPPIVRSYSNSTPSYSAIVSSARRANSARAANSTDRTSPGKLRLSVLDTSSRSFRTSFDGSKEQDFINTAPGIVKRASITSVESFSRYQVKSVEVRRNSSVSSGASTVLHRPSEDRRRISISPAQSRRNSLLVAETGSQHVAPSSPSLPVFDNSPSLRLSEKNSRARSPAPVLNAVIHKRRTAGGIDQIDADSAHDWTVRGNESVDAAQGHGVRFAQNKLDRRVETIIRAISSKLEIAPAITYTPGKESTTKGDTPKSAATLRPPKATNSPALTLSPASAQEIHARHKGETSDIKFYYLKEPGKKDRLLAVRENNNIVVVRVGGGWEELGYHLRTHYGQRSVSQPNVEFQGLPHASATLADAKFSTPTNRPATSGVDSHSAQSHPRSGPIPKLLAANISTTPRSAATTAKHGSISPSSAADSQAGRSYRLSWGNGNEPGLAGPYAKKTDVSEESEQWVQQMVERARRVSGERQLAERKIEIGEIGKAGATRRWFLKSPKAQGE